METKSGKILADRILAKAREYEDGAAVFAVSYARTDNPDAKAKFKDAERAAEIYREMHALVCRGFEEVESELREKIARRA